MIKYFILDDNQSQIEVSQKEHSIWINNNIKKYNREFIRDDGTKQISMTFNGIQEPNKKLYMFSVRSIFRGYDGEIITDIKRDFSTYNEAIEDYEDELMLNGDKE